MNTSLRGSKIGFIGLGLMGKPMALHLKDAGADLVIHNRSQGVVEEIRQLHPDVTKAGSPAEVARLVPGGTIVLMLTNTEAVGTVVLGENGLVEGLGPGTAVIDMSTTGLIQTKACAEAVRAKGCVYLDAPVSGGQVGAREATLSIMAGGETADFERVLPVLQAMGAKVTHVGKLGAGQIAKLANQTIVALTITALAEALSLAKAAGVDPAKVREAIRGGFAESRILAEHGERMVTENFVPGGRARLQLKDVREAARLMEELEMDLPMLERNLALWEEMVHARGEGDLDHSGIWRRYQKG